MAQYDVNLREYWRIIRKRKFIILIITVILALFSTSFAILGAPAPIFTTTCVVEIKKEPVAEGVYNPSVVWGDSDDIETQQTVIKGYAVFERVAERLGLIPRVSLTGDRLRLKSRFIATIENLQSKVEVSRVKYSSILNIKVTDGNAAFAQKLANTVALVYKEVHEEQQTSRAREALKYIDEQLRDVRERLRDAENRFNQFSKENELISVDLQSDNLVAQTQEIHKEIAKLDDDKTEFENIVGRLTKFINDPVGSGHNFDSIKANPRYQAANDVLVSLLLKRDTLLKDFTPKHPQVVAVSNEIIETAKKMDFLLHLQLRAMEGKEKELNNELKSLDKKAKLMLDKKLEFNRLKREVALYTDMTTLLERKNQEALIKRSEKPEEVNIVKPALLPAAPLNPPRTVATGAMGIVIGFIFGLVVAFIVETFDTSLGAIEDVEQTLKTAVLGVIPQVDLKDIQANLQEKHPVGIEEHSMKHLVSLIAHFVPKSMMAESFRALRANVQFKNSEKKIKTLAITSASPQEGKTLVATNLAITMAQSGMKTLLVGSDLRRPTVARIFGVEASPGLSEIVLGNFHWRESLKTITDLVMGEMSLDEIMITPGLDNLFIITAGATPPNPAELIESENFNRFIEEAKTEFDILIFDTAPILSAVDAAIMGTKMDAVLLLYRVGAVSKGLLKRAITQLEQVKSHVVGVVLNGMRPEVSPDFEDYKHYKYYYSYGEDGKKHRKKKKRVPWFKTGNTETGHAGAEGDGTLGKGSLFGSIFLIAGIAALVLGMLWSNGIVNPMKIMGASGPAVKDTVKNKKVPITSVKELSKEKKSPREISALSKPPALKTTHPSEEALKNVESTSHETQKQGVEGIGAYEKPVTAPSARLQAEAGNTGKPSTRVYTPEENPMAKHGEVANPGGRDRGKTDSIAVSGSPPMDMERKTGEASKTGPSSNRGAVAKQEAFSEMAYSVCLGHFRTPAQTRRAISIYEKMSLNPYWVKVDLGKSGIWFRVFTGQFENRDKAEAFIKEHGLIHADIKHTAFAILIGVYISGDELREKVRALGNLDYSPYEVRISENKYKLFVGAFITEEGARKEASGLKSFGIEGRVVKR